MKFRRNIKEEKLFRTVALLSLIAEIILIAVYLTTNYDRLLDLIITLSPVFPLYLVLSNILKKHFVELKEDKIIFINGNENNIVINIDEIQTILIPSATALKNKIKENNIAIKRIDTTNIIPYKPEIENYIKETYELDIVYYDDYSKAINSI
ncbi:MAG: hypothetical protein IJV77_04095 [Clostridia bacterium]|nr:hypothetical protein [Clostridia bacterium]